MSTAGRRVPILLVASLAAAAIVLLGGATAKQASAKCQPHRADDGLSYFDSWYRALGYTVGGVYSDILNYSPWVQPGSTVTGWVMLTSSNSTWAQVGWWEDSGGTRHTFVQVHDIRRAS